MSWLAASNNVNSVLITGATGSGGSYLADYIAENFPNIKIHGISRWRSSRTLGERGSNTTVRLHECDLLDYSSIARVLEESRPDVIFHLASHANVRASFDTPLAVLSNNVMGTGNLLEAVRCSGLTSRFQMCSTSEVYGKVLESEIPISESTPLRPASPYAASKASQDLLSYSYFVSYGMPIIRTRMFAYLNPRRVDLFATSFAMQVARIEAGLQKKLLHGNLSSVRTIIDVRDAMEAYWVAATVCLPGEAYNIGGTTVISVGDFLDTLISLSRVRIETELDQRLLRPADVTLQVPCTKKFEAATGWRPRYSFEESVSHLLEYCRSQICSRESERELN